MLKLIKELPNHWVLSGVISLFSGWMYLRSFASPVGFGFYLLFFILSFWAMLSMKRILALMGFSKAKVWFNYIILMWALRFVLAGALLTGAEVISLAFHSIFLVNMVKELISVIKTKQFSYGWALVDSMTIWSIFLSFMTLNSFAMGKSFELSLVFMEMLNFVFISILLMLFGMLPKPSSK